MKELEFILLKVKPINSKKNKTITIELTDEQYAEYSKLETKKEKTNFLQSKELDKWLSNCNFIIDLENDVDKVRTNWINHEFMIFLLGWYTGLVITNLIRLL